MNDERKDLENQLEQENALLAQADMLTLFAEAESDITLSAETLGRVASIANTIIDLEDAIAIRNEQLVNLTNSLKLLTESALPDLMQQIGLSEFTLQNGSSIVVKNHIRASIPKARQNEAMEWLETNGFGSLIKRLVFVEFGKGQTEEAKTIVGVLREKGYAALTSANVHAQTLGAFVREQLEKGTDLPKDLLGIFEQKEAKVIRSKKRS